MVEGKDNEITDHQGIVHAIKKTTETKKAIYENSEYSVHFVE